MSRIALEIHRLAHDPAAKIGYSLEAVRFIVQASLQHGSSLTPFRRFVVDTGAPVSLLPMQVWRGIDHTLIGSVQIGGIVARDECRIPARLAMISMILSDRVNVLGPLRMHAYLAESDRVPCLLGVCDAIERGWLNLRVQDQEAWFECRDRGVSPTESGSRP